MNADDLKAFLQEQGVKFTEDRIQNATRVRGPDGEIFCVYDSGKFVRVLPAGMLEG